MDYPWYELLNNNVELQQGDLIPSCPIFIPPREYQVGAETEIEVKLLDSIVLSQSCDLVNSKVDIVLVCPYMTLKTFISNLPESDQSARGLKKVLDNLRKGNLYSYHLLNKDESIDLVKDCLVVDFRNVYGIHFTALTDVVSVLDIRYRVLPPYREHLSQSFARYFMRIGLPQDINLKEYQI